MQCKQILSAALMAVVLSACASGPPAEGAPRYHGTYENSCSPVDALATAFELWPESRQSTERVSFVLWPRDGISSGQRVRLGLREEASGAVYRSPTEWDFAEDGEIYFERYSDDGIAGGWFWMKLASGPRLEGWFEADWQEVGTVYCG